MSSFQVAGEDLSTYGYDLLGGWQDELAKVISVQTGTKKMSSGQIDLMNKKYEEAKGYKYTGNTIDPYVAKNAKVSTAVAKAFRMEIERAKALEIEKQKQKQQEQLDKMKKPLKWYHWVTIAGGMVVLVALAPTLNTFAKMVPTRKQT